LYLYIVLELKEVEISPRIFLPEIRRPYLPLQYCTFRKGRKHAYKGTMNPQMFFSCGCQNILEAYL
jgi:hypothetical protein